MQPVQKDARRRSTGCERCSSDRRDCRPRAACSRSAYHPI